METTPIRFLAKCPACKSGVKHEGVENFRPRIGRSSGTVIGSDRFYGETKASEDGSGYDVVKACACGRLVRCKRVYAHGACETKCSAICTNAKGPACDCSCRGKNHGGG